MLFYFSLPLLFVKFWFFDMPVGMVEFFFSLNSAFLRLFSLSLFVKTFFKPLKNEYRKGLVGFSICMGMFLKTILIVVDLILLFILSICELAIVLAFVLWPVAMVYLLFK